MKQKIKCESCNKVIAEGQIPAAIIINCQHCGARNDLDIRPFTERLGLERKRLTMESIVDDDGNLNIHKVRADIQNAFIKGWEEARKKGSNVIEIRFEVDPYIEYGTRHK